MEKDENHIEYLPKENPYKVPANYFEEFPHRIQEKCVQEGKVRPFKFPEIWSFNFIAPAAMIIVLLYTGIDHLFLDKKDPGVSKEAIAEYIESGEIEMNETMIIESFETDKPLDKTNSDKEALIDYLIENEVEYDDIYAEL